MPISVNIFLIEAKLINLWKLKNFYQVKKSKDLSFNLPLISGAKKVMNL